MQYGMPFPGTFLFACSQVSRCPGLREHDVPVARLLPNDGGRGAPAEPGRAAGRMILPVKKLREAPLVVLYNPLHLFSPSHVYHILNCSNTQMTWFKKDTQERLASAGPASFREVFRPLYVQPDAVRIDICHLNVRSVGPKLRRFHLGAPRLFFGWTSVPLHVCRGYGQSRFRDRSRTWLRPQRTIHGHASALPLGHLKTVGFILASYPTRPGRARFENRTSGSPNRGGSKRR